MFVVFALLWRAVLHGHARRAVHGRAGRRGVHQAAVLRHRGRGLGAPLRALRRPRLSPRTPAEPRHQGVPGTLFYFFLKSIGFHLNCTYARNIMLCSTYKL